MRKLAISLTSATYTPLTDYMNLPIRELIEVSEDVEEVQREWRKTKASN